MNFTRVIFRPLKHLRLIGSWFPKGSAKFFSVLLRRNSTVAITIFCIVCFEAVTRGLDDVLNNRSKCADFPGIILPFGFKPLKIVWKLKGWVSLPCSHLRTIWRKAALLKNRFSYLWEPEMGGPRESLKMSLFWSYITIFCIVCFEAVTRGLDDVLNNRSKCADFPGIILPFGFKPLKISHVKFTYPGQRPKPITSDLKQQRRRRLRKRHLKSGFALLQTVSRLFHLVQFVNCWQTILELNSKRLYQGSRKIKSFVLVHVLHKTRSFKIWHFHIVVVQWRQRNVQKSVMHVQSCCLPI